MAEDADLRQKLVGTWDFSATNTTANQATQTMSTETKYSADGTFRLQGTLGLLAPTNSNANSFVTRDGILVPEYPFSRTIGGSGVWHVDQGFLYTTVTNSTGIWRIEQGGHTIVTNSASMRINLEHKDEIISLTSQSFTYRRKGGQLQTAIRKP